MNCIPEYDAHTEECIKGITPCVVFTEEERGEYQFSTLLRATEEATVLSQRALDTFSVILLIALVLLAAAFLLPTP